MKKWFQLFMIAALFLASCSFFRLVMDDCRCYDTALRLHEVFQAARRVDGEVRLLTRDGHPVVEGGGLMVEIPDTIVLAAPADGLTRFRGGVVQGEDRAWLCATSGTGSAWWVKPGGGLDGRSEVAEWFLRGLRE